MGHERRSEPHFRPTGLGRSARPRLARLRHIAAIVAFVVAGLGMFNAFGDTAGIVSAVIAILIALFALVELIVPQKRAGRVSLFTVGVAVLAIVISGARLGGFAIRHDTGTLTSPSGDTVGDRLP